MASLIGRLFGGNKAKITDVHGNLLIGDNHGIVIQTAATPVQEPVLPWREIDPPQDWVNKPGKGGKADWYGGLWRTGRRWLGSDAEREAATEEEARPVRVAPHQSLDIFNLFSWRSRLAPTLVGRDADRERLLAWAKDDSKRLSLRLLTGPGGAGKSRLAAEVAQQLRDEGWISGVADMSGETPFPLGSMGVFVIIDYPEAHREAVRRLLRTAGRLEKTPCKVRLLLVSRCPLGWWDQDLIDEGASELCDAQDVQVGPLCAADAFTLIRSVAERAAKLCGKVPPELDETAVTAWHDRRPQLHGLPLFATAAAVHAVLEGQPEFRLAGGQVISALVKRERKRLDLAGRGRGWGERAAARLHALAALRNGLDAQAVQALAAAGPPLGLPEAGRIVDDLIHFGWLEGGLLPAPQPDLLAAELLYQVLRERQDAAPHWLAVALPEEHMMEPTRLDRLAYDMAQLHPDDTGALVKWLCAAVERHAELAGEWDAILRSGDISFRLAPLGVTIGRRLLALPNVSGADRAAILNNYSVALSRIGDEVRALASIREAVEIRRQLVTENPIRFATDLASSLNNLSNRLSEVDDTAGALDAIREAMDIYRKLWLENPARFAADLARSLNNLSNRLSGAGDGLGALDAIRESVKIRRQLWSENPAGVAAVLANSLSNLSICELRAGDMAVALVASEEAVDLYRPLAAGNPARFEPDLGIMLRNLALSRWSINDAIGAVDPACESVNIFHRLAQGNPERFGEQLWHSQALLAELTGADSAPAPGSGSASASNSTTSPTDTPTGKGDSHS